MPVVADTVPRERPTRHRPVDVHEDGKGELVEAQMPGSARPADAPRAPRRQRRGRAASSASCSIAAVALLLVSAGCKRSASSSQIAPPASSGASGAAAVPLRVPATHTVFNIDGELKEPVWNDVAARTHAFLDPKTSREARPYSEARFLWDHEKLYLGLYAADDDLRAGVKSHDGPVADDDAFHVEIRPDLPDAPTYVFDISPAGVVADAKRAPGGKDDLSWESGIQLGVDMDGTLNNSKDMDEEWVIESAIPLAPMGLAAKPGTRFTVAISRCDTPHGTTARLCGSWGTPSEPRLLELGP